MVTMCFEHIHGYIVKKGYHSRHDPPPYQKDVLAVNKPLVGRASLHVLETSSLLRPLTLLTTPKRRWKIFINHEDALRAGRGQPVGWHGCSPVKHTVNILV